MSLDFYLTVPPDPNEQPHKCFHCGQTVPPGDHHVYSSNITHNLTEMARAAGIHKALWRPEEIPATHARDIVQLLDDGLRLLVAEPDRFRRFNSPNGWGRYDDFVEFVRGVLDACRTWPNATIRVSR